MNVDSLLIVEDISEAMTSLIRIAQSAFPEARIDTARSMKEARLQIVQRQWSMALVDIGLPDGSGLDLVRLFSELAPETVCVVSTVLGDDAHIVAGAFSGRTGLYPQGAAGTGIVATAYADSAWRAAAFPNYCAADHGTFPAHRPGRERG